MIHLFREHPDAIENTLRIAERCELSFTFGEFLLPQFQSDSGESLDELLVREAEKGLAEKLPALLRGKGSELQAVYLKRLREELEMIRSMGFSGYFLIVADFVRYAKEKKIPVGPGRGSAAGSLVAFAIGITSIDPIRYGLFFERFLNPGGPDHHLRADEGQGGHSRRGASAQHSLRRSGHHRETDSQCPEYNP
jgi:DNA polymerase-3 subunit alpha